MDGWGSRARLDRAECPTHNVSQRGCTCPVKAAPQPNHLPPPLDGMLACPTLSSNPPAPNPHPLAHPLAHLRTPLALPTDCARSSCCWPWLRLAVSDCALARLADSWAASLAGSASADCEACGVGVEVGLEGGGVGWGGAAAAAEGHGAEAASVWPTGHAPALAVGIPIASAEMPAHPLDTTSLHSLPYTTHHPHTPTCRCSSKPVVKAALICWKAA